jgi:Holliday junction resolvase YEN1
MSINHFRIFLDEWRNQLREVLRLDPQNLIGQRNSMCAKNISNAFPDPEVIYSYLDPLTSLSCGQTLPVANGKPTDIAQIGELCERYFEWATPADILPKFLEHIWPGVVLTRIREDIMMADNMHALATASVNVCVEYWETHV